MHINKIFCPWGIVETTFYLISITLILSFNIAHYFQSKKHFYLIINPNQNGLNSSVKGSSVKTQKSLKLELDGMAFINTCINHTTLKYSDLSKPKIRYNVREHFKFNVGKTALRLQIILIK